MANHQLARIIPILFTLVACVEDPPTVLNTETLKVGQRLQAWQQSKNTQAKASAHELMRLTTLVLSDPDNSAQSLLQESWRQAHEDWLVASFLAPEGSQPEIDAWPIEPGFIDALPNYPQSGLVNDRSLEITATVLRRQHMITHESEVALGFHVLEYYAFARPVEDLAIVEPNHRRRELVTIVADLLQQDIDKYTTAPATDFQAEQLIELLQAKSRLLFREYNLLGEHSQFSDNALANIRVQLNALVEILGAPVELNRYLIELDANKSETLNITLNDIVRLLSGKEVMSEEDNSRTLLLMSSLSHQFEDFSKLLPGEG